MGHSATQVHSHSSHLTEAVLPRAQAVTLLVVSTLSQKVCWSVLVVSMYTFSSDVSHDSNHLTFRSKALPGYSSCAVYSFKFSTVLFIMKATLAWPVGSSGSSDVIILRFLLKHSRIWHVLLWSRCVSCTARIAIRFSYIVLLIELHFCRRGSFAPAAPLMFRVAMLILALFAGFTLHWWCVLFSPGVGLSWCAQWWFRVPRLRVRFSQRDLWFLCCSLLQFVWGAGL